MNADAERGAVPSRHLPGLGRLAQRARLAFSRGLTRRKIIFSVLTGVVGGIFPVLGTTTVACILLAFLLRSNHAITQLVNWLIYPLQIILIIPLMKLGTLVFSGPGIELTLTQVKDAFQSGILEGLRIIGIAHLYGILGWALVAIPSGLLAGLLVSLFYDTIYRFLIRLS